jgi:hypothetical protein
VDIVTLDRDDDRRRRDVPQQLPVRDRPVLDHAVDRTGEPVGIVVLPQHAVELQAPGRLDVLGHAGRIVQHGLERLLRRLALQVLGEQVVAVRQPERQVQSRRQQPDHPCEPVGFAAHEVPDRARAERGPHGDRRAERVGDRVYVPREVLEPERLRVRGRARPAVPSEVEPHLGARHQRREGGELVAVVRQPVREDGDGLALALHLTEQGRVVGPDVGHQPNLPKPRSYDAPGWQTSP